MIESSATVRKHPRIAIRMVAGKALLVVLDEKALHVLNGVGARIWELCDGRSLGAIAHVLVEEFIIDEVTALGDVCCFVEELTGLGALVLGEAA